MILRHLAQRQQLAGHGAIARLHALQLGLAAVRHDGVERQRR
jgi:hypothetical protein